MSQRNFVLTGVNQTDLTAGCSGSVINMIQI